MNIWYLNRHMNSHYIQKTHCCLLCQKAYKTGKALEHPGEAEMEQELRKVLIPCEHCEERYSNRWALEGHMIQYHPEKMNDHHPEKRRTNNKSATTLKVLGRHMGTFLENFKSKEDSIYNVEKKGKHFHIDKVKMSKMGNANIEVDEQDEEYPDNPILEVYEDDDCEIVYQKTKR